MSRTKLLTPAVTEIEEVCVPRTFVSNGLHRSDGYWYLVQETVQSIHNIAFLIPFESNSPTIIPHKIEVPPQNDIPKRIVNSFIKLCDDFPWVIDFLPLPRKRGKAVYIENSPLSQLVALELLRLSCSKEAYTFNIGIRNLKPLSYSNIGPVVHTNMARNVMPYLQTLAFEARATKRVAIIIGLPILRFAGIEKININGFPIDEVSDWPLEDIGNHIVWDLMNGEDISWTGISL